MKKTVKYIELFTITPIQQQIMEYNINSDEWEDDMKRRLQWSIDVKLQDCINNLRNDWTPILIADGATSIPVYDEDFAALVFAHPDYKDRKSRDESEVI